MGALSRRLLGISLEEVRFDRRGFRGGDAAARQRIEQIGAAFIGGYHTALELDELAPLADRLVASPHELQGFAFEGASMGLKLKDALQPWRRPRWPAFLAGPGEPHAYMVHVGAGWAMARLGGRPVRFLSAADPLLRWLIVDGFGFHEGYFHAPRVIERQIVPAGVSGYARRAFDQGLGRSLWFVEGSAVEGIASTLSRFPESRHADLWSGVGLAAAYAGGVEPAAYARLRERAGAHAPRVAQGAAFAAKARLRAGLGAAHTERACEILCEMSAVEAAAVTDQALEQLPDGDDASPAYEHWRRRIQAQFSLERAAA